MTLRALARSIASPQALRAAGFPAAPEQSENLLAAVGLVGPRGLPDVRRAAHAVFGPGPERRASETGWPFGILACADVTVPDARAPRSTG